MSKTSLIIAREYISRVRKKSFIIMSIIGPLLFAGLMIIPAWLAQMEDKEEKTIAVIEYTETNRPVPDSLMIFKDVIPSREYLKFEYLSNTTLGEMKELLPQSHYYAILFIPHNVFTTEVVEFYTKKQPSLGIESHITRSLEKYIRDSKLIKKQIPLDVLNSAQTDIKFKTIKLEKGEYEEQELRELRTGVGYASGFLIYFFIFFFGSQVMRGVIEEKTSRIVEVMVSSVKPFQLMMGKVVGIGLVGLTQFLCWAILTAGLVFIAQEAVLSPGVPPAQQITPENFMETETAQTVEQTTRSAQTENPELSGFFGDIQSIRFGTIICAFLFYFLGGYLLYGAFFAAIGSAVDSEADTQQFMLPVTIPLVISILVMINAITNPEGQIAFWFSMIPLTSPVIMMARIPFGVPWTELTASMLILITTFILCIWLAGKIYRTGILMYGKKSSYKEIWKWIRHRY